MRYVILQENHTNLEFKVGGFSFTGVFYIIGMVYYQIKIYYIKLEIFLRYKIIFNTLYKS